MYDKRLTYVTRLKNILELLASGLEHLEPLLRLLLLFPISEAGLHHTSGQLGNGRPNEYAHTPP